jgi:hypothetical protein
METKEQECARLVLNTTELATVTLRQASLAPRQPRKIKPCAGQPLSTDAKIRELIEDHSPIHTTVL